MIRSTDDLIATLTEDCMAVKPASSPFATFAGWMLAVLVYMAAFLCFAHRRDDLALRLHDPLYLAELASLVLIMMASMLAATLLSFPDMHQKRWLLLAPLASLLPFFLTLTVAWLRDNPPAPLPVHGIECTGCILFYSFVPAVGMIYAMRRQAVTHPRLSGAIVALAASATGCFMLRLTEKTDSMRHLVEWHYLPIVGFALIGIFIGRKFLKW